MASERPVVVIAHAAGQGERVQRPGLPLRVISVDTVVALRRGKRWIEDTVRGKRRDLGFHPKRGLVRAVHFEHALVFEARCATIGEKILGRRHRGVKGLAVAVAVHNGEAI